MPIDQLPKSFAIETNMHIGNESWKVDSAKPMTYEEKKKTKRLQLVLNKIVTMPTKDILYSVPTLSKGVKLKLPQNTYKYKFTHSRHS